MWHLGLACLLALVLVYSPTAVAVTVPSPSPSRTVCGGSTLMGEPDACSSGPAEDSALLQMGGRIAVQQVVEPAAPLGNDTWPLGFPTIFNAGVAVLLQEESARLELTRPSRVEMDHFNLVKALRQRGYKCPDGTYFGPNRREFEFDCRLWRAARLWSMRMGLENFVEHKRAGSNSCKRTEAQGFPRMRGCGENIAAGRPSPQECLQQLQASNHHCLNMMEPKYNKLGVGYYSNPKSEYKDYWTDSFGDWHQGPDQSCIGGSPAPTPAPGCADIDTMNCGLYKNMGLCSVSPNVRSQCTETCNINGCGIGNSGDSSCRNQDGACRYYMRKGYCKSSAHIRNMCKASCGTCNSVPVPRPTCIDHDGACAYYKAKGFCTRSENVRNHCRRSCGLCGTEPSRQVCSDSDGNCNYYRAHGYCSSSPNVQRVCRRSCGLCR